jgi:predicted phosphohydrolase
VYFVLGNHDFYGSSFEAVDRIAAACCAKHSNLLHLGHGEIIPLGSSSALIGHRGWADGRAYTGKRTSCRFPDQDGIRDLRYRSTYPAFRKMEKLGRASGDYFRRVLPYAMTSYNHIVIATHFPPFACAARFDNRPCKAHELAHYVNASAGGVIQRIGEFFPKSRMTVLSGHTHHAATACISPNLEIRVGAARRGDPKITEIFEVQ